MAILAVRALGTTDLNPVSGVGKVSQIIFGLLAPGHAVANVVAGAIAEAGATQVGDLMQDLKTGHMLRASPRVQFYAQLVGSTASVFVTVFAYQLYLVAYEIPSEKFPAPVAYVWKDMAQLMNTGPSVLPESSRWFAAAFGLIGTALPVADELTPVELRPFIPSGISMGIGMYVTPDWTIPRFVGAAVEYYWRSRYPESHTQLLLLIASGFVLGEGVLSIFVVAAAAAVGKAP